LDKKYNELLSYIKSLKKAAVAFSGGVDSAFLLKAAKQALGNNNIIAVTANMPSIPRRETDEARDFCANEGITHIITEINQSEIDGFTENPKNRCYICKKALFEKMKHIAAENGISGVIEGSNADDMNDYRPGMTALSELGIKSPMRDVGYTKAEIRAGLKELGLDIWKKQSFACLATRFVYGEKITAEKLKRVEAAESLLLENGFNQLRVRIHGNLARIEITPDDFGKFMKIKDMVYNKLKEYGFDYITLDLKGYRTGSMNEGI